MIVRQWTATAVMPTTMSQRMRYRLTRHKISRRRGNTQVVNINPCGRLHRVVRRLKVRLNTYQKIPIKAFFNITITPTACAMSKAPITPVIAGPLICFSRKALQLAEST